MGDIMNKLLIAFLIIGLVITTTACSNAKTSNIKSIAEIKSDSFLGKTVTVQGTVVNNVKLGSISGYRLQDSTDYIAISAQNLPKVNTTVTVTGILQKSTVVGYYIVAME